MLRDHYQICCIWISADPHRVRDACISRNGGVDGLYNNPFDSCMICLIQQFCASGREGIIDA